MDLEKILESAPSNIKKVREYFSGSVKVDDLAEYGLKYRVDENLKKRIFSDKSDEERKALYDSLKKKIEGNIEKYSSSLDSLSLKLANPTGMATILNSTYHLLRGTAFDMFKFYHYGLVGAKALLELPAMYDYLKKSGDVYGAVEWVGYKALSALVPVIGPIIDYDSTKRIIKGQIIKESVNEWLTEQGHKQESFMDRIKNHVKKILIPYKEPELQPA